MRKRSGRGSSAGARMRPRIGITGQDAVQLKNYIEAVEAAGGEAVPLTPGAGSGDAVITSLDGLVLTGGEELHPKLSRQQLPEGGGGEVPPSRGGRERSPARRARRRAPPRVWVIPGT